MSLGNLAQGIRKIQIRRREDGMMIDRVMIANDIDKLPATGDAAQGPAESPFGPPVGIENENLSIVAGKYSAVGKLVYLK